MATDTSYMEAVAAAVETAIQAAGTNRNAVATAAGIPRNTLLRRLAGNSPFTVQELAAIAECLGIPVEQLSAPRRAAA